MTDVLLATSADFPTGEPRGELLVEELDALGLTACWARWDDPEVAWASAGLVAVRSPWDYERRRDEFVAWAHRVEAVTRLVNPARALAWNTDKGYLCELQDTGLPVVPTLTAAAEDELQLAIAGFDRAVVKPRVGAGGRGVVLFDGEPGGAPGLDESGLGPGPWVVQPLVESVRTEGELSVFVLGGRPVSQVRKVPADGDIRVQEWYGGRSLAVPLTDEATELATRAVTVAERRLGTALTYARADLMRLGDGTLAVGELELAEPGLYLDLVPENARAFAEAVAVVLQQDLRQ